MVQDPRWSSKSAEGYPHIVAAVQMLESDSDPRHRLRTAATLFWKALLDGHCWPDLLRSESAALIARLFRYGPIHRTVEKLPDEEVKQTLEQLKDFCRQFLDWDKDHPPRD